MAGGYQEQPVRQIVTPEGYRAREVFCRKCQTWKWIGYFVWLSPGRVKECVCKSCQPAYRLSRQWKSLSRRRALSRWAAANGTGSRIKGGKGAKNRVRHADATDSTNGITNRKEGPLECL